MLLASLRTWAGAMGNYVVGTLEGHRALGSQEPAIPHTAVPSPPRLQPGRSPEAVAARRLVSGPSGRELREKAHVGLWWKRRGNLNRTTGRLRFIWPSLRLERRAFSSCCTCFPSLR